MLSGEFTGTSFKANNVWNIDKSKIKSIFAEDGVTFTGDCTSMFSELSSCESIDLSNVDAENVTNMAGMFRSCTALKLVDVSGFDTSNVKNMNSMFYNCTSLTSIDVSSFDTGNVGCMSGMFYSCSALTSLDLSGFNMSKVTRYSAIDMLNKCSALKELTISENCTNGIWNMMHLSNGQNNKGWCIKGSTAKVSGDGSYAVIAAPTQKTTYALIG